ncbi:MAG: GGDEF domain-containing protein [Marinobacter sp.]|nr:GGDEF domain-containing protein [Marinobacter sp.]
MLAQAHLLATIALSLLALWLATRFIGVRHAQRIQAQTVASLQTQLATRDQCLAEAREQLARLALTDQLTGLLNRAGLTQQLDYAAQRALRHGCSLAVIMIDLDNFKRINDQAGQDTGDQALITIAERLKACARGTDMLARVGSDEFVLIAEQIADNAMARQLGQRLAEAIETPFELPDGEAVILTASIGISLSDGRTPGVELLRHADFAMHHRKRSGRSGVSILPMTPTRG